MVDKKPILIGLLLATGLHAQAPPRDTVEGGIWGHCTGQVDRTAEKNEIFRPNEQLYGWWGATCKSWVQHGTGAHVIEIISTADLPLVGAERLPVATVAVSPPNYPPRIAGLLPVDLPAGLYVDLGEWGWLYLMPARLDLQNLLADLATTAEPEGRPRRIYSWNRARSESGSYQHLLLVIHPPGALPRSRSRGRR